MERAIWGRAASRPPPEGRLWPGLPSPFPLAFQIPLSLLLPVRMENLLPACKNIGATHITNGCYHLHPVEWNSGESAGLLTGYCLDRNTAPRQVRRNREHLEAFQGFLREQGVELEWPGVKSSAR